jgi:hypothetical protein
LTVKDPVIRNLPARGAGATLQDLSAAAGAGLAEPARPGPGRAGA